MLLLSIYHQATLNSSQNLIQKKQINFHKLFIPVHKNKKRPETGRFFYNIFFKQLRFVLRN